MFLVSKFLKIKKIFSTIRNSRQSFRWRPNFFNSSYSRKRRKRYTFFFGLEGRLGGLGVAKFRTYCEDQILGITEPTHVLQSNATSALLHWRTNTPVPDPVSPHNSTVGMPTSKSSSGGQANDWLFRPPAGQVPLLQPFQSYLEGSIVG